MNYFVFIFHCYSPRGIAGEIFRECSLTLPLEIKNTFFWLKRKLRPLQKKKNQMNSFVCIFHSYSPRGIAGEISRECSLTLPLEIKNTFFWLKRKLRPLQKKNQMNSFVFIFTAKPLL